MKLIPLIIILLTAIVILLILKKLQAKKSNTTQGIENFPVKKRKLLSEAEVNFYQALRSILSDKYDITCKCRLEDIMYASGKQQQFRNRIKSRHIDFVIFDPVSGETISAIELDDKSHENKENEDKFKDKLFQTIGMKLTRIKAKVSYTQRELENTLP